MNGPANFVECSITDGKNSGNSESARSTPETIIEQPQES